MASATDILRQEHDVILEVIGSLETVIQSIGGGKAIPVETLNGFTEFFAVFADRSHHGKEEDLLFPMMEAKGVPRARGPLGCMLTEHDEGRGHIRSMKENAVGCAQGEAQARQYWIEAAQGYATLLRNHIWKENEILFRMAERILSPQEQAELAVRFGQVQKEKLDQETEERLAEFARTIGRDFAIAVAK